MLFRVVVMPYDVAPRSIERSILVFDFLGVRKNISLNTCYFSIGRHPQCSLTIEKKVVSRHHATIVWIKNKDDRNKGCYWILDGDGKGKKSKNGVYVNGKKISKHQLICGDLISVDNSSNIIYNRISNVTENLRIPEVVYYL